MIQKVYAESAVHCAIVFRWYDVFSEGRESIVVSREAEDQ